MNEEYILELKEMKANNLSYFDSFYEKTKKNVFFACYSILKRYDEAEDIMQEVYIKFLETLPKLDLSKSVLSYLLTIAHNLSINKINKDRKKECSEVNDNDFQYDETKTHIDNDIILEKMRTLLSEEEHQIVILHCINDMKHIEIAKHLKIPLGTVTYKYSEAIKKLQKGLGDFR